MTSPPFEPAADMLGMPGPATPARHLGGDRNVMARSRQARVGILRNTNAPPAPPARRVALTGKWPSLRSSRRAPPEIVALLKAAMQPKSDRRAATTEVLDDADPVNGAQQGENASGVRIDDNGRVAGIDIDDLMAAVQNIGDRSAKRVPFGAEFRPDIEIPLKAVPPAQGPVSTTAQTTTPHAAPARPARASILSAESWLDLEPSEQPDMPHDKDLPPVSTLSPALPLAAPFGGGSVRWLRRLAWGFAYLLFMPPLVIGGLLAAQLFWSLLRQLLP